MDERMIGMDFVEDLIYTVLSTAWSKKDVPLSLLIVAPSGAGKSKTIKQFVGDGIHFQNDLTTFDLNHICETDEEKQVIHHIVIPDLNLPLSHRPSVAKLMIATLLGLTSENTKMYVSRKDGRHEIHHRPMGLISAITPDIFWKNARKFSELGFLRRMPPVFYEQGDITIEKIITQIQRNTITFAQLKERSILEKKEGAIKAVIPKAFNGTFEEKAVLFTTQLNGISVNPVSPEIKNGRRGKGQLTKVSPLIYLRCLAVGHATSKGRTVVNETDIKFIGKFLEFTDCNNPKRI